MSDISVTNPFSDPETTADVKEEPIAWQEALRGTLVNLIKGVAADAGMYPTMVQQWVNTNYSALLSYINRDIMTTPQSAQFYTQSAQGLTALTNIALQWAGSRIPALRTALTGVGGGTGRTGPTAAEIRASFDLSQLATNVSKMARGYLLQEHEDPRAVARAYVDAVVANPAQKLDFQEFVLNSLRANPRWNTLYKNKPAALDELQYIGQYTSQAQQLLGANRGQDWSGEQFNAMAIGADPQAWQQRIERSNTYTSQAPFVAKMQERVSGLSQILKG